ncbi:MAG: EAL domain-containing protein [Acidimicrobiales bacterium]
MAFEVDDVEQADMPQQGVSGAVIQALVAYIRGASGDSGLAQALALASENRSFLSLGDDSTWTPVDEAAALFAAGALVTGDDAIALHVGEELLWGGVGADLATRIQSLDSPEVAFRHVGALVEQFEGATDAVALEVAPGWALIEVSSVDGGIRHAHLCELTRGFLSELPALFDFEPAVVSEHECGARGGRACRYALHWEPGVGISLRDGDGGSTDSDLGRSDGQWLDYTVESPAPRVPPGHGAFDDEWNGPQPPTSQQSSGKQLSGKQSSGKQGSGKQESDKQESDKQAQGRQLNRRHGSARHGNSGYRSAKGASGQGPESSGLVSSGPTEAEILAEQLAAARAALIEAVATSVQREAEAARLRADEEHASTRQQAEAEATATRAHQEVQRLELLIEGTSVATLGLVEQDLTALLSDLASRADQVVGAERFLLMVRPAPGMPIELHHRGLGEDAAGALAAELWNGDVDQVSARTVVDIASPRRRYGRLAVFDTPGSRRSAGDERILRHFALYAANVLDVYTVVSDARRSDTTARTILSFLEQLSGLTDLTQALRIVADAVPGITGCVQATVYRWDEVTSRLAFSASTTGMAAPDADLGPIAPEWFAARSLSVDLIVPGGTGTSEDGVTVGAIAPSPSGVNHPHTRRMASGHQIMVLDRSNIEDPELQDLMDRSGMPASVIAPMIAAGAFIGVIAANFSQESGPGVIHDTDLHERLCGLADQAAAAIQNIELLEKVSHMAWHDALTGLPNRRLFEDRVEQELVRSRRVGEPVCMFFVDLDNFKTVNDTHGHATGDILIKQVSQRLLDTVRSQDTVARVGGDEFAILLPGLVDQLSINQLAERTLEAMHTPFSIFGEEVSTSASIGIAIAPEHGDSYDDLLNRADEAMYRAKDLGRDAFEMFRYSPDPSNVGRRAIDDRELYTDMVSALDADEFFLVYQPYVDLRTAQVVGVEALVRWDHPTLGILDPPRFIPMAEKSDLIVSLDNWVLWQACRQLRSWQDHGIDPLRLSVNLASRDLASPDFFDSVKRTLNDTGIDPALLELEITERVVLDKTGPAMGTIEKLRKLGVKFTIDNFGMGNSSLDRIGTFPVSTLKIDQSFVQVLGPEDEENSLVSAIIAMAGRLGLSCVAEGVETLTQSRVLLQRGCTTAQGYYFSPPLPADAIEEMLTSISPAEVPDSFGDPTSGEPSG